MRASVLATAIAVIVMASPASAQTSQCQWIGTVWSCSQSQTSSGIRWDLGQQPDIAGNAMRAYENGRRTKEERERAKLEAERIAAERDFYRAQAQALSPQGTKPATASAPATDYSQKWLDAARPRMHLFPDFEKIVFAPDVAISPDMVMLMSSSPMAADIAYYLATHRREASVIYKMPPLDAARAIDRLEKEALARTQGKEP